MVRIGRGYDGNSSGWVQAAIEVAPSSQIGPVARETTREL
jgi:hypothetical protein